MLHARIHGVLHSAWVNSGGRDNSYQCTKNSCGGVRGGTKPWSMSSMCQVRCPAVEKLASLQQAPGRRHNETCAGHDGNLSLLISQAAEIIPGCADMVVRLLPPFFSSVSPGPGREVRSGIGWTPLEKQLGLGWKQYLFSLVAGDWVMKGSFLTAWAASHFLRVLVHMRVGEARLWEKRCWTLLATLWRAIAPVMKPWCAEGEVPTAANLNLCLGRKLRVEWHSDNEPLFGERGETKLIVSVSFGTSALFKWKGKSCPSNVVNSCFHGHGDILVMDGQCQDEFLLCTDPGSDQERINVTFHRIKQHVASCSFVRTGVACCLPTCARFFSVLGTELVEKDFFFAFWLLLGAWCILGVLALLVFPLCVQGVGLKDVPPAAPVLWAEVGGGIIFVTPGEFAWQHKTLPVKLVRRFVVLMVSSCTC